MLGGVERGSLGKTHSFMLWYAKPLRPCLTLCNPMDHSPPGSSVRGILQVRILKWVASPSSGESSPTQGSKLCLLSLLHCRRILYPLSHWGSSGHSCHSGNSKGLRNSMFCDRNCALCQKPGGRAKCIFLIPPGQDWR